MHKSVLFRYWLIAPVSMLCFKTNVIKLVSKDIYYKCKSGFKISQRNKRKKGNVVSQLLREKIKQNPMPLMVKKKKSENQEWKVTCSK